MQGVLIDAGARPDITLTNGHLWGGLHCGDCFSCLFADAWIPVRLEYLDGWVLVKEDEILPLPYGTQVKI